ncbi:MAG: FkbM family methyltransferase [Chitinophagaceae bacterium]|nr:FkbM family methyltransferase [Chitinophagaceae bacterium]
MLLSRLWLNRAKHLFYRGFTNKQFLTANCEKYDLKFNFFIKDGVGKDIYYKYGVYSEDHITNYLLNTIGIRNEDFIVDIGANIGWHSMTLSSSAAPTVFSFEPDPFNFNLLSQNKEINNKTNVKLFNVALSNENGKKTLYLYKDHNLGRHSLIQQQKSVRSTEVTTVRLDNLLEKEGMDQRRIKLIKIDVEGFEYMAMLGAKESLKRTDYLLTEFTPGMMRKIDQDPKDYIDLLREAGFKIQTIDQNGLHTPDFDHILDNNQQVDFFCSR